MKIEDIEISILTTFTLLFFTFYAHFVGAVDDQKRKTKFYFFVVAIQKKKRPGNFFWIATMAKNILVIGFSFLVTERCNKEGNRIKRFLFSTFYQLNALKICGGKIITILFLDSDWHFNREKRPFKDSQIHFSHQVKGKWGGPE